MKLSTRHDLPDPRSFVKSAPLPLPSHQGVKIQARTLDVYNASIPIRDDIRKENYLRRQEQMNSMGFQTPANIPYRVIGSPLYLDQKQIILYGLGQISNSKNTNQTVNNELTVNNKAQEIIKKPQKKPVQTFSFRNLKDSKELINLQNEVKKAKDLVRRVKLGQSLFDILNREEEDKARKSVKEKVRKNTSEMKIRPMLNSEDEIDQEQFSEEEITESNRAFENQSEHTMTGSQYYSEIDPIKSAKTFQRIRINENSTEKDRQSVDNEMIKHQDRPHTYPVKYPNNTKPRPQTVPVYSANRKLSNSTTASYRLLRQSATTAAKKKLPERQNKPYTPVYSTLLSNNNDDEFLLDKQSITRQLCVLLWILDSISVESPNCIGELRTCFHINELGGERTTEKQVQKIRDREKEWINFKKSDKKEKNYYKSTLNKNEQKTKRKVRTFNSESINDENINTVNDDETESKDNSNSKRLNAETPSSGGNHDQSIVNDEDSYFNSTNKLLNKKQTSTLSLDNVLTESVQDVSPNVNHNQPNFNNTSQNPLDTNRDSIIISNLDILTSRDYLHDNLNATGATPAAGKNMHESSLLSNNNDTKHMNRSIKKQSMTRPLSRKKSGFINSVITEYELDLLHLGDEEEMDKIFNKPGVKIDRRNSKSLKATVGPVHAFWTQAVYDYQNNLPSVSKSAKLEEIKNQFNNIIDEKTIEIHKRLEQLVKKRSKNCLIKFSSIDFNERGLHNILKKMNKSVIQQQRAEEQKNAPGPKFYQWFLDIKSIFDSYYCMNDYVLGTLIERLSFYGKLNTKKQNEASFFRILSALKVWELLNPDVMSAVEFCRSRILEIKEDQFETWLKTIIGT